MWITKLLVSGIIIMLLGNFALSFLEDPALMTAQRRKARVRKPTRLQKRTEERWVSVNTLAPDLLIPGKVNEFWFLPNAPTDGSLSKEEFHLRGSETVGFKVFIPMNFIPYSNTPAFLYLHTGKHKAPTRLGILRQHGLLKNLATERQFRDTFGYIVIAPQLPAHLHWGHPQAEEHSIEILEFCLQNEYLGIDRARVVLTGVNEGALGSWVMAARYPRYFSALVPVNGPPRIDVAWYLDSRLPIWVFHHEHDEMYDVAKTDGMIEELMDSNHVNLHYMRYTHVVEHGQSIHEAGGPEREAYRLPRLYDWINKLRLIKDIGEDIHMPKKYPWYQDPVTEEWAQYMCFDEKCHERRKIPEHDISDPHPGDGVDQSELTEEELIKHKSDILAYYVRREQARTHPDNRPQNHWWVVSGKTHYGHDYPKHGKLLLEDYMPDNWRYQTTDFIESIESNPLYQYDRPLPLSPLDGARALPFDNDDIEDDDADNNGNGQDGAYPKIDL